MSVLKSKRQASDFEVFHQYYHLRREIADLLLRDFGYSESKEEKRLRRQFGDKEPEGEEQLKQYEKTKARDKAFDDWFVVEEREAVLTYLRNLGQYLFSANNIYPQYKSELEQRRIYQGKALGCCEVLMQELQYIIETLPVNINKYTRFADMIQQEINLIKGWRKADNKFKKIVEKDK